MNKSSIRRAQKGTIKKEQTIERFAYTSYLFFVLFADALVAYEDSIVSTFRLICLSYTIDCDACIKVFSSPRVNKGIENDVRIVEFDELGISQIMIIGNSLRIRICHP